MLAEPKNCLGLCGLIVPALISLPSAGSVLAKDLASAPVVYMTGASADQWTSQGVPNSILLQKPFAPAQLMTAVSQLLNAPPA
jgi:hypothetical protein